MYHQGRKDHAACAKAPQTCKMVDKIPDAAACKRGQVKNSREEKCIFKKIKMFCRTTLNEHFKAQLIFSVQIAIKAFHECFIAQYLKREK